MKRCIWISATAALGLVACTDASNSNSTESEVTPGAPTKRVEWAERGARATVDYPAIVVGSGYGGSVAALRLGNAGVKTLVLERGRDWTVLDPTTSSTFATLETVTAPGGDVRSTWMNTHCGAGNAYLSFVGSWSCPRGTGILEEMDSTPEEHRDASPALKVNGIKVVVGAGVGGGSLVNAGVVLVPTKQGWDAAFPPSELPFMQQVYDDLQEHHFQTALSGLGATPTPQDILDTEFYRGSRLMA